MNNCVVIIFLLLLTACSKIDSSKNVEVNNKVPISHIVLDEKFGSNNLQNKNQKLKNEGSKPFDCSDSNGYKVEKNRDDEFNLVNIVQDDKVVETLKLPTGLSQNGFALNWAKKTQRGFEISIEYGSRFYYQKEFNFECKESQFYLTKIITNTFDKNDPKKSWRKRKTNIKPNIPFSNFKVTDYITN